MDNAGIWSLPILLTIGSIVAAQTNVLFDGTFQGCEPLRIRRCAELGYNMTRMPNLAGLDDQKESEQQMATFDRLVRYGCSDKLQFLLCTVYAPVCQANFPDLYIKPCFQLCESVRMACQAILKEFGYPWPQVLNCQKFPKMKKNEVCASTQQEINGKGKKKTGFKTTYTYPVKRYTEQPWYYRTTAMPSKAAFGTVKNPGFKTTYTYPVKRYTEQPWYYRTTAMPSNDALGTVKIRNKFLIISLSFLVLARLM